MSVMQKLPEWLHAYLKTEFIVFMAIEDKLTFNDKREKEGLQGRWKELFMDCGFELWIKTFAK